MATKTTIAPLYDRVLCKRVEAASFTEGAGLFIPEAARERPQEAIVVAVGCGKAVPALGYQDNRTGEFIVPNSRGLVNVGDRILIGKYAGAEVSVGKNDYLILREDEVLGVINTEEVEEL